MREPVRMKFSDLPTGHYFTSGWLVCCKTGDRVAIQTSGLFDGAGTYHHFAPDEVVYSWGDIPPAESDRLELWSNSNLAHTLLTGYSVDLTKLGDAPGQGNFHVPGAIGHA